MKINLSAIKLRFLSILATVASFCGFGLASAQSTTTDTISSVLSPELIGLIITVAILGMVMGLLKKLGKW